MSALPSIPTYEEYLNEQLINCLNVQTNVIQNLAQYSQHISFQLIEIRNNVNILANRILTLQQQQSSFQIYPPPLLPNPLLFYQQFSQSPPPFSFSSTTDSQPSRIAPFVFGPINSQNVITVSDEDDDYDHNNLSDEPKISFNPIITLSPVETKTGEEDENILFNDYAKLYRFDSNTNQMKERGRGELKILQHKQTKQCRILMRRDQVFKICANHKITSQMELKLHQTAENAYIWSAFDFADGQGKYETLCVKFKTNQQAKKFEKIFNESKGDLPSIGNMSLNDDDVILIGELMPTFEQMERAKQLQLPLTFYLYETKEPCKGCRGCKEDLALNEIQYSNRINPSNFPSAFFPNSSLSSLMSMVPNWSSDGIDSFNQIVSPSKDHRTIIKAKRTLPTNRAPPPPPSSSSSTTTFSEVNRTEEAITANQTHQKKSRNFSGYKIESYSIDDCATKLVQTILDEVKQELHKQIVTTKEDNSKPSTSTNLGFSFANFDNKTPSTTDFQFSSQTTDQSSTFTFGNLPKISFADLAKQFEPTTDDNEERRIFPGQGSLIFGTNSTDDGTVEDTYEPTKNFKPIVKLFPVEVKTGEEDENILFCERAKLYRFDSTINQMKERGIGEIKILQHKTTNSYRVLMRRDQVFKICANHKITSQMELKPHQSSENAYIWSAMDYSDGEAKHETLCVKFKTSDIAKKFFQQFNNAAKFEQ